MIQQKGKRETSADRWCDRLSFGKAGPEMLMIEREEGG